MERSDNAMHSRHAARSLTSRLYALLAAVFAAALVLGTMTSLPSYAAEGEGNVFDLAADASERVPVVETTIGRGEVTEAGNTVELPGSDGYDSALVRISVFDAVSDTTVSVSGSEALAVAAGRDASQTVLAPISEGSIAVSASAEADVRIEVLAMFHGDESMAGSTNALADPSVWSSATQDSEPVPGTEPIIFALADLESVSDDARAVYVTMAVDAPAAGTVTVAGQPIDVPAGSSVISTIVVPDSDTRSIEVSADEELNQFTLSVRGWVCGTVQEDAADEVSGGFVSAVSEWIDSLFVSPGNDVEVDLPGTDARAFSIVLAKADAQGTAADADANHTFLDLGDGIDGRSHGVVVDDENGALAQIEVADVASSAAKLSVRGADVEASVMSLGVIVGELPDDSEDGDTGDGSDDGDDSGSEGGSGSDEDTGTDTEISIQSVEAGSMISFAVDSEGSVWIWGAEATKPWKWDALSDVKSISANGSLMQVALLNDGTVWQWGSYMDFEGNNVDIDAPEKVEGISNVVQVETGSYSSGEVFALCDDGSVWYWESGFGVDTPQRIEGVSGVTKISADNGAPALALTQSGEVYVVGGDIAGNGTVNFESVAKLDVPGPVVDIASGGSWTSGSYHNAVLLADDGTVYELCIDGSNADNTVIAEVSVDKVTGLPANISSVEGAGAIAFAVTENGEVWAWGSNDQGQLGNGTFADSATPVRVEGLESISQISASANQGYATHVLALCSDGSIWAWGNNSIGQLGNGTTDNSSVPVQVQF